MVKSVGSDNLNFTEWLDQLSGQSMPLGTHMVCVPQPCVSPNSQKFVCDRGRKKQYTFFSQDFSQALLDCGYSFAEASKYGDVIKSLSGLNKDGSISIADPVRFRMIIPLISHAILEESKAVFAELDGPVKIIYEDLKKFGQGVPKMGTADVVAVDFADELLTVYEYLKADLEKVSKPGTLDPDEIVAKAVQVAIWTNAINSYFQIQETLIPLSDNKIGREVLQKIAVALAMADNSEISKASQTAARYLALNKAMALKKEFVSYSGASVRIGDVKFAFHYETKSEQSFLPVDKLNSSSISLEYKEISEGDPERGKRLNDLVIRIDETETFLERGAPSRFLLEAGGDNLDSQLDLSLKAIMDAARESNVEGFMEGVAAREATDEAARLEDPNSYDSKAAKLVAYTTALGELGQFTEKLRKPEIYGTVDELAALDSTKRALLAELRDIQTRKENGEVIHVSREELSDVIAILEGVNLPEEIVFGTTGKEVSNVANLELARRYLAAIRAATSIKAKEVAGGWIDTARDLTNADPASEKYIDTVAASLREDGIEGFDTIAKAADGLLRHERVEPMKKSIDEQLVVLEQMLVVAKETGGVGLTDHISPIEYTIQLLERAKLGLSIGHEEEAEAIFAEAVFSPHFEYVRRVSEISHYAMLGKEVFNTALEVGAVALAGYCGLLAEIGVSTTRAGIFWGRVKNITTVVRGFRNLSRLQMLGELAVMAGKGVIRIGPRALRFTAHAGGFHLGSSFLHEGRKGIWDTSQDGWENLGRHGLGTLDMMFILGSIGLGLGATDLAITRGFLTKRAITNLTSRGVLVTQEAIRAEVAAIKVGLKGFEKWAYRGGLFGGEYASFTLSEGSKALGTEVYHKGFADVDYRYIQDVMFSGRSQWQRLTFLTGLKIYQNTLGKPITMELNRTAAETIYSAHRDLFDSYNTRAQNALLHVQRLAQKGPEKTTDDEMMLWIGELKDAIKTRIALKERLPKFMMDGSVLEEKAAIAELEAIEKGGDNLGAAVYFTPDGYVAVPRFDMHEIVRRAAVPKLVGDKLKLNKQIAEQMLFEAMGASLEMLATLDGKTAKKSKKGPPTGGAAYATLNGTMSVADERIRTRKGKSAAVRTASNDGKPEGADPLSHEEGLRGVEEIVRKSLRAMGRLNASNEVEIRKAVPVLLYFFTGDEIRELTAIEDPAALWSAVKARVFGDQSRFSHQVEFLRAIMLTAEFMTRFDNISGGRILVLNDRQIKLLRSSLVRFTTSEFDEILPRNAEGKTAFTNAISELAKCGVYVDNLLSLSPEEIRITGDALIEYIKRATGQDLTLQQRDIIMSRVSMLFSPMEALEIAVLNPAARNMAVGTRLFGNEKSRSFLEKDLDKGFVERVILGLKAFAVFKKTMAVALPFMPHEHLLSVRSFVMHKNLRVFSVIFETLAERLQNDPQPNELISYVLSAFNIPDPFCNDVIVEKAARSVTDALKREFDASYQERLRDVYELLRRFPHQVIVDISRLAEEEPERVAPLLSVVGRGRFRRWGRSVAETPDSLSEANSLIEDVTEPAVESAFKRVFGVGLTGGQLADIYSRLVSRFSLEELEAISLLGSEVSVLFMLHTFGAVDVEGILKTQAEKESRGGSGGPGGSGNIEPFGDGGFGRGGPSSDGFDASADIANPLSGLAERLERPWEVSVDRFYSNIDAEGETAPRFLGEGSDAEAKPIRLSEDPKDTPTVGTEVAIPPTQPPERRVSTAYAHFQREIFDLRNRIFLVAKAVSGAREKNIATIFNTLRSVHLSRTILDSVIIPLSREVGALLKAMEVINSADRSDEARPFRDMVHDFRNWATAFLGYASLWESWIGSSDGRVLDLTVLVPPVDLFSAIFSIETVHGVMARAHRVDFVMPLQSQIPPELAHRQFDMAKFDMFARVLQELALNGVKYYNEKLDDGREVRVDIGVGGADGDLLFVEVRDNGRGMMPSELRSYLSTEQWRSVETAARVYGNGLGSGSIVSMLNCLGAVLNVLSEPGKGSTFRFVLPVRNLEADVDVTPSDKMKRYGNRPEDFAHDGLLEALRHVGIWEGDIRMQREKMENLLPSGVNKVVVGLANNNFELVNETIKRIGLSIRGIDRSRYVLAATEPVPLKLPTGITFSNPHERAAFEDMVVVCLGKSTAAINEESIFFNVHGIDYVSEAIEGAVVSILRGTFSGEQIDPTKLELLRKIIIKQNPITSPVSVARLRRVIPPAFREKFLQYFGSLKPIETLWMEAETIPIGADFARLDSLAPSATLSGDNVHGIAGFVDAVINTIMPFAQRYEALNALKDIFPRDETLATRCREAWADLVEVRSQIYARYGKGLEYILSLEKTPQSVGLRTKSPYIFREIESILGKAHEQTDHDAPYVFRVISDLSFEAEKEFRTASKGRIPAPPILSRIDSAAEREAAYHDMATPLAEAYASAILPIRARQNAILPYHGPYANAHDYLFERWMHIKWDDAASIAERFREATQADNDEFIRMSAEALGVMPDQLKSWDVDYAFERMIGGLDGGTAPKIKVEDALRALKEFCKKTYGIDMDNPWYGVEVRLGGGELYATVGAGKSYVTPSGAKVLAIGYAPGEEITVKGWKGLAHEVGHVIHYILREEAMMKETSGPFTSTHSSYLSEAFAQAMEGSVYRVAGEDPSLGFAPDYLFRHKDLSAKYDLFRLRRTAMFAQASRLMYEGTYSSMESKRGRVVELQREWLGVNGDPDYAFWDPRLVSPRHHVTYLTNVIARNLLDEVQGKADAEFTDLYQAFIPILSTDGALTSAEMVAKGLPMVGRTGQQGD